MNVRPTLKVSKTSFVFKVEQTRGGSFGRIDDKDKNNNDNNDEGRGQKKTGSYGKNSQTGGGGSLTQTHFLMSTFTTQNCDFFGEDQKCS